MGSHSTITDSIRDHIGGLVRKQSTTVDLAFYETPEIIMIILYRARDDAS